MDLKGLVVEKVLVEQQQRIAQEYYAGMTLDRAKHRFIVMLSAMGGVDIEEVAASHPDAISRTWIDPGFGLPGFQIRDAMLSAGYDKRYLAGLQLVLSGLYSAMQDSDAMLAEINPLAITEDGAVIAADAKFDLDDNSLYRHPDFLELRAETISDPVERLAAEREVAYVRLDGNIGVIGNGAGLVMTTLDVIKQVGGSPANFLDIGGGARAEVVRNAIETRAFRFKSRGNCDQYLRRHYARGRGCQGSARGGKHD